MYLMLLIKIGYKDLTTNKQIHIYTHYTVNIHEHVYNHNVCMHTHTHIHTDYLRDY